MTDAKKNKNASCPLSDSDVQVTTCFEYFVGSNGRLSDLKKIDNVAPLGDVTLTYDAVSRVKTVTDGKSRTTTYSYDALDRVTKVQYNDGSAITFSYDASGNRVSTPTTATEPHEPDGERGHDDLRLRSRERADAGEHDHLHARPKTAT